MRQATEIINRPSTQQTKPSTENTPTYAHSEECFDYVWRGLQAARLLTKDMGIDSVDYRYWRSQLSDMTDKHLQAGFRNSGTFHGFFTWAEFRKLCIEGYNQQLAQKRQAEQPPEIRSLEDLGRHGNKRWRELLTVTHAMQEEVGEGPITKASRDGRLTGNFIRGKSAQEIIDHCKRLYGDQP